MEPKSLAEYMAPKYEKFDNEFTFVPHHMRDGIKLYIEKGIEPGGFLRAVLENDLKNAVGRADDINRNHLVSIVAWFYNYAPAGCFGSVENYNSWVALMSGKGLENDAA